MAGRFRLRLALLTVVLVAQTGYFFAFLHHPIAAEADNIRYEVGAWNLAEGRGYVLPVKGYAGTGDDEVADWVYARHAELRGVDELPTAMYMPGYSLFASVVYKVCGRSLPALAAANFVLLLLLFVLFEQVAARWLDLPGYLFAMGVAIFYPFIARGATMIMSDHLHALLWFAALAVLMLRRPGPLRGVAFGLLMSLATLTRPYSMLVFPALWLWPSVRRGLQVHRREWLAGVFAFAMPFTIWTARNVYWFGHFLPFTTSGVGAWLYETSLEWDYDVYDPKNAKLWYEEISKKFGGDLLTRRSGRLQLAEAKERIAAHPLKFAERIAVHVPKLWVSVGSNTEGRSRALPVLILYLGGLLVLGLYGAWLVRADARWHALLVAIAANWIFLLPFPAEARRTIPLRLPMLLLAGVAVSYGWRAWQARPSLRRWARAGEARRARAA